MSLTYNMFLLINGSVRGEVSFASLDAEGATVGQQTYTGQNKDVIIHLVAFLQESSAAKEDITGIGVVEGVGGFTSTRIATLVANTFAYTLNIPVIGISEEQFAHPDKTIIEACAKQSPGALLHPTYSGEPNIRM